MSEQKFFADGTEYTGDAEIGSSISRAISCYRCGGSGIYSHFHGACYACNGTGKKQRKAIIYSKAQLDKKAERKKRAKRKKEAEHAARIEASKKVALSEVEGAPMALMQARLIISSNRTHGTSFMESMIAKLQGIAEDNSEWTKRRAEAMVSIVKRINEFDAKLISQKDKDEALRSDPSKWIHGGKLTIEGKVLTVKWKYSQFGDVLKMLVQDDEGRKFWGSVPRALDFDEGQRGMRVKFNATVERSQDDPIFGFFKRPTKASLIEEVAAEV